MIIDAIAATQPERVAIWRGHGIGTTGLTGTMLVSRFGMLAGFQQWSSSIVCWAMGGYGLGLTGTLKTQYQAGYGGEFTHHSALGRNPGQPA